MVRHRQDRQHDRVAALASDQGRNRAAGRSHLRAAGTRQSDGFARAYLYSGGKDTLFRIHGTNQPEYIGASISSGCIRMTNEDAIDLYNRVKIGTIVVVLEPHHGDSPFNSQMALARSAGQHRRQPCNNACCNRTDYRSDSKAPVLPALFCLAAFRGVVRASRFRPDRMLRFAASDLMSAASRGGASSGRSAGSSGAICGNGSHTFHWQIL